MSLLIGRFLTACLGLNIIGLCIGTYGIATNRKWMVTGGLFCYAMAFISWFILLTK